MKKKYINALPHLLCIPNIHFPGIIKVYLILSFMLAGQLFFNSLYAQTIDLKVTFELKNQTLESGLNKLGKISDFRIAFTLSQVAKYNNITVEKGSRSLKETLNLLLENTNLTFVVKNKRILVVEKRNQQPVSNNQINKILGRVVDIGGKPLPGVNITTDNPDIYGTTDTNGDFDINISSGKIVNNVFFSFIGLKKLAVAFKGSRLKVIMENDSKDLDEVVVTGLVTHDAKSFTGDASVYKGEDLKTVGRQNIIKSLSLLDPSVSIVENSVMGSDPNTLPQIRFRGESSFQGFENIDKSGLVSDPNQPLFILDGYQTTLATILDMDMNRVESVTVLKDAAAGAIYGSRAANGVIVVKTIQPKEGQLKISYGLNMDISLPDLSSYNLLTAKENLELYNKLGMYRADDGTLQPAYNQIARWVAQGVNTDWLSQPVQNSIGYKHSLNLSGGDQRMRYSTDLNYSNNQGVMKGSYRDNYGLSTQLSYNLNDKLFVSNRLSIGQTNSKESPYGSFTQYTTINSFYPIYDKNGKLNKYYYYTDASGDKYNVWGNSNNIPINPLYEASVGNLDKTESLNINDNLSVEWMLLPSLRLSGMLSYISTNNKAISFLSPNSSTYADYSGEVGGSTADEELLKGKYTYTQTFQKALESNIILTWSQNIGKHFATASVGGSMSDSKSSVYGFTAEGFGADDPAEPAYAAGYEVGGEPANYEGHTRLASFFASSNYAYDNRYLFDFSYRLDGSSQFGTNKKTAPFYSFGLGWNAHNESFIKQIGFVNMLKLRATYGEVGSANFTSYQARDMYANTTSDRYDGNIGVILEALGNSNLKWQTTNMAEVGTTIGLFNKIDLSMSLYNKLTSDMVLPITTPPSMGFSSYVANLGKMKNTGYEFLIRGFLIKKAGFNVSLFGSVTHNKNKILSISSALEAFNKKVDSSTGYTDDEYKKLSHKLLTKYEEGQSTTAIYAVRSLGIDPMTGNELFLTKDGKPTFTWSADDKVVVGDTEAKLKGTFGTNVGWKGLFLNATFSYSWGGQIYNSTLVDKVENSNKYQNVDKRVLTDTWQNPGDVVQYKANITTRYTQTYTYASSRFVQDYNYVQLSSLSLQYEMPRSFIRLLHLESLRWSLNTSDLLYFSTVDRERGTSYPYAHSFSIGLRANF